MSLAGGASKERISCLLVTKGRLPMLRRSISFFARQTWAAKELMIVNDGDAETRRSILAHVEGLRRTDIRCVFVDSGATLGRLRNVSVAEASGDVLCQWDDDDYYHPRRLAAQIDHLRESDAEASFFYDVLNYFADTGELFWTDWSRQRTRSPDRGHPGTLMCTRSVNLRYPVEGKTASRGEDAVVQLEVYRRHKVVGLRNAGFLYTYVYHGANTLERSHHRLIVDWMGFRSDFVQANLEALSRHLSEYFPSPLSSISCKDGPRIPLPPAARPDLESTEAPRS